MIRADGNAKTGAGHLMRCLTIGEELTALGQKEELLFVCADAQSAELVRQHRKNAAVLGTDYRDMESELPIWEKNLPVWMEGQEKPTGARGGRPVILVDSYYVTGRYLEGLRRFGFVALMDDMGQKSWPADAVINYNAPAEVEGYRRLYGGTGTELLIGSAYAPLRRQFWQQRYEVRRKAETVLITTGGGDAENIAGKILHTLYDEALQFHLVAGQFNPHFQALKRLEDTHENIRIHSNVTDMAGLMAAADIAVTAGGSTVYELAALGVPFICFSYAENQEPLTEYIGANGIAGYAGAYHKAPEETLAQTAVLFRGLVREEAKRRQYQEREKKLIDGRGAVRLAAALKAFK